MLEIKRVMKKEESELISKIYAERKKESEVMRGWLQELQVTYSHIHTHTTYVYAYTDSALAISLYFSFSNGRNFDFSG